MKFTEYTACMLTFTIRFLTVSVNVYQNKFITASPAWGHHPVAVRAPGSVSTQSLVTGVATAQPGHLQLVLARAPRTWPGLTRAGLSSLHKTGPNTNSSMVRNLSEKLITKCNVLIHIIHFVYRSAPHCTGQPLLHVSVVLRNALSPLTRCGPYDTRYHSRQTHTKWHNINFHREPAIARLNSSRMSQYMSMSTN